VAGEALASGKPRLRHPSTAARALDPGRSNTTVKPLFGNQEGAVVGYNPGKPGRPSHSYHSYLIANLRLVLDVEVHDGNQTSSKHGAPGLWALLDRVGQDCRPALLRGDSGGATKP